MESVAQSPSRDIGDIRIDWSGSFQESSERFSGSRMWIYGMIPFWVLILAGLVDEICRITTFLWGRRPGLYFWPPIEMWGCLAAWLAASLSLNVVCLEFADVDPSAGYSGVHILLCLVDPVLSFWDYDIFCRYAVALSSISKGSILSLPGVPKTASGLQSWFLGGVETTTRFEGGCKNKPRPRGSSCCF